MLDAFYLSDFEAQAMGFNLTKSRLFIFTAVALLVASSTAFCGPIAFLGMAVPHLARMIFKDISHKKLIVQSMLIGLMLALAFDIISQNPFTQSALPINSIAALFGAPLVVVLLWKKRQL